MFKNSNSNKLSIYLIKDDWVDSKIIENYEFYNAGHVASVLPGLATYKKIELDNHIVYLREHKTKPKKAFENFYYNDLNITTYENHNISIADIYTINYEGKIIRFAITFGLSKLINKESIVERFGLKTLLSWFDKNSSFKELSTKNVSKQGKTTIQHLPRYKDDIREFDISKNTDIVKGIIAYVKILFDEDDINKMDLDDSDKKKIKSIINDNRNIEGADNLSLKINFDHMNIIFFLTMTYKAYVSNDYKKNDFEWIDNINEVKNKEMLSNLNDALIEEINNNSKDIWLSFSYDIYHMNVDKISYLNKINKVDSNDISLHEYKTLKKESLSFDCLGKDQIYLFDIDDNCVEKYSIYELLSAEIEYENDTYVLDGKIWYIINNDFKIEVEKFYDDVKCSDVELPNNIYKREEEYNSNIINDNFINMDREIIYINKNDKFELCDILSTNKELIHIKKYGSSSQLTYLFLQGLRSIEEIKNTNNLDKINEKIHNTNFILKKDDDFKIIFAIITSSKTDKPKLPFFAKSCFKNVADKLNLYEVDFYIKSIYDETKKIL